MDESCLELQEAKIVTSDDRSHPEKRHHVKEKQICFSGEKLR